MGKLLEGLAGRIEPFVEAESAAANDGRHLHPVQSRSSSGDDSSPSASASRTPAANAPSGRWRGVQRENQLRAAADSARSLILEDGAAGELDELVARVADLFELTPAEARWSLFVRAAGSPEFLQLPPSTSIDVQLTLLCALAPVSEVSLWSMVDGSFEDVASVGPPPTTSVQRVALDALETAVAGSDKRRLIQAVPVLRWRKAFAAVAGRALPGCQAEAADFLGEASTLLSPVLERQSLLEQAAVRERELVSASERRLLRLGYDLHDGPLQDVAALAADLRVAQAQLTQVLALEDGARMRGCFEDLTTRVQEIDQSLREMSQSLESTRVPEHGLPDALQREVDVARRRSDIEIELELEGDFENLTASQRIAIQRVVQESLTNIRDHSGATRATITIGGWSDHIAVCVEDNGKGFDVPTTLIDAAARGRLGLVGMSERIRLLGGTFNIRSEAGRGTAIALTLARWKPLLTTTREALAAI